MNKIHNTVRTKKVICAHEAAHAALCHYHNIQVNSVEVTGDDDDIFALVDGSCRCDYSGHSDIEKLQMIASGFALEWHEDDDKQRYLNFEERLCLIRNSDDSAALRDFFVEVFNEVDDCEKIDDFLQQIDPAQREKQVVELFRDTWEIMKNHYLPVIMTIAEELERCGSLNREQVEEIFDEAFPLGSPRDDFDHDNDEAA